MKILDRYIIRQFIVSFVFGLVAAIAIFVVANLIEMTDDFIDAAVPAKVVFQYYMAFIPEIIKYMVPVAVLLASLFITGRLSSQNELAAMKSSGISLYRIMGAFMFVVLFICAGSVYFNGWIVPFANQKKFTIERIYLKRTNSIDQRYNILFQEDRNRTVSINYYEPTTLCARMVSIQDFDKKDLTVLRQRYDAAKMQWIRSQDKNPEHGTWVLLNGSVRRFSDTSQTLSYFDSLKVGKLTLTPADIEKKQQTPDEMDFSDLKEFIRNQKRAGQDVARWEVEYHFRFAFPFASIIMILFGVPFASSRPRTGTALGFGIAISVTFIYLIFMKSSQVFGYNGDLDPMLTAWLANLIFLAAGIFNLFRIQK
jgi:lipopolysaccharide export system permease protein